MDLEDLIKKANEKEINKEYKGKGFCDPHTFYPYYQSDNLWVLMLLLLLLDFPKKEEKAPVIEIYIGGDE